MASMKLYSNTQTIGVYMTDTTGLYDRFFMSIRLWSPKIQRLVILGHSPWAFLLAIDMESDSASEKLILRSGYALPSYQFFILPH